VIRSKADDVLEVLDLRLKDGGQWNRCQRGIPFVGFVVYPDRLRLGRMGRQRLRRKFRKLASGWRAQRIGEAEFQNRATSLFAHAAFGDDLAWRRTVLGFTRCESNAGEMPEPRSRDPRRVVEQHGQELPLGESQQEQARQPQQESGLPGLSGSRHEDDEQVLASTDVASSRSRPPVGLDKTSGKPPAGVDICAGQPPATSAENTPAVAPGEAGGRQS